MTTSDHGIRASGAREVSPWARGFAVFAAVMMIMIGVLHIVVGLAAIIENEFYVIGVRYAFQFDVTAWGWVHLLFGVLVAAAGWFVFAGAVWARTVGIVLASLSLIANFVFIPYYPVWAIVIMALDVAVIWALCVYGRDSAVD